MSEGRLVKRIDHEKVAGAAAVLTGRLPGCSFLQAAPNLQVPRWKNWQTTTVRERGGELLLS